jgi:hypothetical protein
VELYKRAVAAAELALPRDSLVIASLLTQLLVAQCSIAQGTPGNPAAAERAELQLRLLYFLHARWQAGTLFAPTAEEVAYLAHDEYPWLPVQMCGAFFYISAAANMAEKLRYRPPGHHLSRRRCVAARSVRCTAHGAGDRYAGHAGARSAHGASVVSLISGDGFTPNHSATRGLAHHAQRPSRSVLGF